MAAIERLASRHNLRDRRGLLPGASGDGRRPACRHHRHRGCVQFLSDEEPRRARRRWRGRDARSGARGLESSGCATAGRRTDIVIRSRASTRGSTKCRRRFSGRGSRGCRAGPKPGVVWPRHIARRSRGASVDLPAERDPGHVYHLFVVRSPARAALQAHLSAHGIETLIHYPVPIPRQPALARTGPADCPVAAQACDEVLSLPLHPALNENEVRHIAAAVAAFEPRVVAS